ncbi:MAG: 2-aminoethylphosphonate aminotransferase [Planctomycetota bacterium]|jgi:2-aminoethylphosphonate-pyruvate transaminase
MRLLNPGPVNLSERVRAALQRPDLCHREPEYIDLQNRVRSRLLDVYGCSSRQWSAILITGSGTAAVEAMLSSLVPPGGTLVVVENGVYGERLARIAEIHGISAHRVPHEWGAPIDLARVAAALDRTKGVTHLAAVHHETTTGRLNDLAAMGDLCLERDVRLLVDAVSSYGAESIDFDRWPIEACAASANKCLHGIPGLSFVLARRAGLGEDARPRSLTLDLRAQGRGQDRGETLFTPPVPACQALDEALVELAEQGGWPARQARYAFLAERVRSGLERLGILRLLPDGSSSCVLTSFRLPPQVSYSALHDGLKRRGFIIYAGQGALAMQVFRVATMGAISEADVERFVTAAGVVLEETRAVAPAVPPVSDLAGA